MRLTAIFSQRSIFDNLGTPLHSPCIVLQGGSLCGSLGQPTRTDLRTKTNCHQADWGAYRISHLCTGAPWLFSGLAFVLRSLSMCFYQENKPTRILSDHLNICMQPKIFKLGFQENGSIKRN